MPRVESANTNAAAYATPMSSQPVKSDASPQDENQLVKAVIYTFGMRIK